ncbi:hypothetical protein [Streptomyces sp. URMC 124]|uniref:hypothetical protein n=1 Tax=Streptomyces sp. URMC 124 TaxID=3423405 RepID=UPI003F1BA619
MPEGIEARTKVLNPLLPPIRERKASSAASDASDASVTGCRKLSGGTDGSACRTAAD